MNIEHWDDLEGLKRFLILEKTGNYRFQRPVLKFLKDKIESLFFCQDRQNLRNCLIYWTADALVLKEFFGQRPWAAFAAIEIEKKMDVLGIEARRETSSHNSESSTKASHYSLGEMNWRFQGQLDFWFERNTVQRCRLKIASENHPSSLSTDVELDALMSNYPSSFVTVAQIASAMKSYRLDKKMRVQEQFARMIVLEYARIIDHLTVFKRLFTLIRHPLFFEHSHQLNKRMQAHLLPLARWCENQEWDKDKQAEIFHLRSNFFELVSRNLCSFEKLKKLIIGDPVILKIFKHEGMKTSWALEHGISGPHLRACGINMDARKTGGLFYYDELSFEVPVGSSGDLYDGLLIRLEECCQSIKMISQIFDNLPSERDEEFPFSFEKQDGGMYLATESSRGEIGVAIDPDKKGQAILITPSQSLSQIFPSCTIDLLESQGLAWYHSLDFLSEEFKDTLFL